MAHAIFFSVFLYVLCTGYFALGQTTTETPEFLEETTIIEETIVLTSVVESQMESTGIETTTTVPATGSLYQVSGKMTFLVENTKVYKQDPNKFVDTAQQALVNVLEFTTPEAKEIKTTEIVFLGSRRLQERTASLEKTQGKIAVSYEYYIVSETLPAVGDDVPPYALELVMRDEISKQYGELEARQLLGVEKAIVTNTTNTQSNNNNTWYILCIVFICLLGVLLIGLGAYFIVTCNKKKLESATSEEPESESNEEGPADKA